MQSAGAIAADWICVEWLESSSQEAVQAFGLLMALSL